MIDLVNLLKQKIPQLPNFNVKQKVQFWATDGGKDPRDLYWKITNEPETDPTDFVGLSRFLFGDAIEKAVRDQWITSLGPYGVYLLSSQASVGTELWSGKPDQIIGYKKADGSIAPMVLEFKTKWGKGSQTLMGMLEPSEDYLIQIGLYLKDYFRAKIPMEGVLVYYLISDNAAVMGIMLQFCCRYDLATDSVVCYKVIGTNGLDRNLDIKVSIGAVEKRLEILKIDIGNNVFPKQTFIYKYPLTQELLDKTNDNQLLSAINGDKVLGDWQIAYSKYKQKHLKLQGSKEGYSQEEIRMLQMAYTKRHPKHKRAWK